MLVRAQKTLEHKSFVIIGRGGSPRVAWDQSFGHWRIYMIETEWYLGLDGASKDAPIDIRIRTADPYDKVFVRFGNTLSVGRD